MIESIQALESSEHMRGFIGEKLCKIVMNAKTKQWEEYVSQITDWELDFIKDY